MLIRVLPSLETRKDWLSFLRREAPYCLVETPEVLVDFQSTFLQLTLFKEPTLDPVRYTLGSRQRMEPAWQLIKGCQWRLSFLIEGLESLDFNTNVRDKPSFKIPTDLSVRKSFTRERRLISPSQSGIITPLNEGDACWTLKNIQALLAYDQLQEWTCLTDRFVSPKAALTSITLEPERWGVDTDAQGVRLSLDGEPYIQFSHNIRPATRRLMTNQNPLI